MAIEGPLTPAPRDDGHAEVTVSRVPSGTLVWTLRIVAVLALVGVGFALGHWWRGVDAQADLDSLRNEVERRTAEVDRLEIALGSTRLVVPDLYGRDADEARNLLEDLGLSVGSDSQHPIGSDGVVRGQFPSPGERVPAGTGVVLLGVPEVQFLVLEATERSPQAKVSFDAPATAHQSTTVTVTFLAGSPGEAEAHLLTTDQQQLVVDLSPSACSTAPSGETMCTTRYPPFRAELGGWEAHLRATGATPVKTEIHIQFDPV